MALDPGGEIYIAWEERRELPLFSRSIDGGTTFTEPLALAPSIDVYSYGQLRMASSHPGEIQAVFTVFETYDGWADIAYASSSDGGATFSEPVFVSEFDFSNSIVPDIATGWATAVVWLDFNFETGETATMYTQSLDGGATFTAPRKLDGAQGQVSCVDVALWGEGSVYAAWSQNDDPYGAIDAWEVVFTRSTDRGETFSTPINISRYSQHSWCPRMSVDGSGTIYLVWAEGDYVTDMKLMFTRSADGGSSFDVPRVLVGPHPSLEPELSLASSGNGNLWISWMTGDPTVHLDGFFIRSIDGGATFSPEAPLPGAGPKSLHSGQMSFTSCGARFPKAKAGQKSSIAEGSVARRLLLSCQPH